MELEKKRKFEHEKGKIKTHADPGIRMSRRSMMGNREDYFQLVRNIIVKKEIDFEHPALQYNSFPTSVRADTKLVKIHYLFQMLGNHWIFVRGEKEHLLGFISKKNLLNLRYSITNF